MEMAEGLPEGLVRNREGVTAVGEGIDRVEADLVATCWRLYSSNKAVLAENIGRRLENFFWRLWGSERLRQRLTGTQVNIQFDIINEGGYIRTTPTASPRSSKSLIAYYKEARLRTPPTTPPATETSKQSLLAAGTESSSGNDNAGQIYAAPSASSISARTKRSRGEELSSGQAVSRDNTTAAFEISLPTSDDSGKAENLPTYIGPEDSSVTPTPTSPIAALDQSSEASKENRRTPQSPIHRPPILKKEGSSGSSRSSRSAKITFPSSGESQASEAFEFNEAASVENEPAISTQKRRPTTTRFNEEVSVSIPKPSVSKLRNTGERPTRPGGEGSQKPGKRNPIVVASTAANKTRPAFIRQRSSTGASRGNISRSLSNQHLARSPSPRTLSALMSAGSRSGSRSKQSPEPRSTRRPRATSPYPSRRHGQNPGAPLGRELVEESSPDRNKEYDVDQKSTTRPRPSDKPSDESSGKPTEAVKPLIDPDFRAKFIDRTRASQRSLTDLSAIARKSSAAVPTSASYQATGMMEGMPATSSAASRKGREAFTNVIAPLKAPASAGPEPEAEDTAAPLPRTKSQLTFLLEKEKARSAKEQE